MWICGSGIEMRCFPCFPMNSPLVMYFRSSFWIFPRMIWRKRE